MASVRLYRKTQYVGRGVALTALLDDAVWGELMPGDWPTRSISPGCHSIRVVRAGESLPRLIRRSFAGGHELPSVSSDPTMFEIAERPVLTFECSTHIRPLAWAAMPVGIFLLALGGPGARLSYRAASKLEHVSLNRVD